MNSVKMAKEGTEAFSWKAENKKYLYWILGVFLFFVLIDLVVFVMNDFSLPGGSFLTIFIINLNFLIIPMAAANGIIFFKKWFNPRCKTEIQIIINQLTGLIIGILIGTAIIEILSYWVGVVDDDYINFGTYTMDAISTNFLTNVVYGLIIGIPVILKQSHHYLMQQQLVEKEYELDKAYQLKIQSELEAIHAKINPHFLYNSLNSIVSLIHEDPDKAEKMVLSLSDLFRYSINSGEGNYSTIKQELDLVRTYLEIENVRFQDQLNFSIQVDPGIELKQIPKFLIQPLIENAIKHGTSKIENGIIQLIIEKGEDHLQISVCDNGPPFPEHINSGYGLKSTVDKLELLYPNSYGFQMLNQPNKRIEIQLKNVFSDEK